MLAIRQWCASCAGGSSPAGPAGQGSNLRLHAHLIGSNVVQKHPDLPASAVLATAYYVMALYAVYKFTSTRRFVILLIVAFALTLLGCGFATRAGVANTSAALVNRTTVIAEQFFFVTGQLLLLDAHTTLSRDLIARSSIGHWPSTWTWFNRVVLLVSWIMDVVAFTARSPTAIYSHHPSALYTNLRIAGSVLPFLTSLANACYLPFERLRHPEINLVQLGLLDLMAWFLVVPAFYAFVVTAINSETSGIVHSTTWFYVGFGLCQALAVAPVLGLPLAQYFVPGPYALGYRAAKLQEDLEKAQMEGV